MSAVKGENRRLQKQVGSLHQQISAAKLIIQQTKEERDQLEADYSTLKQTCNELETSTRYLQDLLNDTKSNELKLYDNFQKSFSPACEVTVMKLLDCNVGVRHIGNVINIVAELCGKTLIDRFPSEATVNNMNDRRLALAQKQVGEILSESINLTLYTDETSKYGTKFGGYHMSNSEQDMYVIGLRELASKSASCTLDTLQEILEDMNETSKKLDGNDDVGRKILSNTIATMSDSASTEKLFNQKLEDLRNKVLPEVTEKWDEMSEEAQKDLSQMLHFFCSLHVLVNLAVQCTTVLNQWQRVEGLFSIGS
ncbi:hypothetical protein ACJMK2_005741 [Sinanodonta woodiana]|uniref:Uncharacterized protein n=1 Tax=Sinanodonta woodiana TaxID=1069815 RepID=A0ABD3VR11_SINWO